MSSPDGHTIKTQDFCVWVTEFKPTTTNDPIVEPYVPFRASPRSFYFLSNPQSFFVQPPSSIFSHPIHKITTKIRTESRPFRKAKLVLSEKQALAKHLSQFSSVAEPSIRTHHRRLALLISQKPLIFQRALSSSMFGTPPDKNVSIPLLRFMFKMRMAYFLSLMSHPILQSQASTSSTKRLLDSGPDLIPIATWAHGHGMEMHRLPHAREREFIKHSRDWR
jgi:hypothetical protein